MQIVDDWGQTISLPQPARRIIPLYGAFSEMLFALGAGSQVIARTQADHYPPEIESLPSVGTHMRPNVEMILGLKPDLVIQSASRRVATAEMDQLVKAGIPVAVFAPQTFEGIFSTLERLGVLIGRESEARKAVEEMKKRLQAVNAHLPEGKPRLRVFFEVRAEPLTAAGRGSIVHQILEAAGAENVIQNDGAMVQYSIEALLGQNPDVYIVQEGPMNRNPMAPAKRPHFDQLKSVREGKIISVDELTYSRPGPRCVDAVEQLAAALYPDRFPHSALPTRSASKHSHHGKNLSIKEIFNDLLLPLVRLSIFVAIGLLVGNLIEGLQWTHFLGRLARPFLRWGHLSDHSSVAFMAAFFSGVTANTLLMNAHQEGKIGERELYFSSMINTLPSFFLHLPTTFFVLLPLVRTAGVLYLGISLLAALLRILCLIAISRVMLPKPDDEPHTQEESVPKNKKEVWNETLKKFKRRFVKVLTLTLPIYTIFFLLNHYGLFRWMEKSMAQVISFRLIPLEALSVVVFQVMTEFTAGVAAAGALLSAGTLSVKTTVLALLIGNVISTPVRALRHQLPYYMGIFTPRLGFSLLALSQLTRVTSVLILFCFFYWFYPS